MGRTSKNIKLRIPEKPHKIKGFRSGSYRVATTISSQSRYDHFDTAPYLSQHQHLGKRGELMGRTSKNIKLRTPEKPRKIKGFRLGSYRVATTISSADPSTAWVHLQIYVISLVPTRRPIQPVEIGKNNRIEQATLFNLNSAGTRRVPRVSAVWHSA